MDTLIAVINWLDTGANLLMLVGVVVIGWLAWGILRILEGW